MKDRFGNRYKLYLTYIFICIGIGWVTKVNVPRPPQVPPPPQRPQEPPPPPPPLLRNHAVTSDHHQNQEYSYGDTSNIAFQEQRRIYVKM